MLTFATNVIAMWIMIFMPIFIIIFILLNNMMK